MNEELLFFANETIKDYLAKAESFYGREFETPTVEFGLRGSTSGRAYYLRNLILLNRQLFHENQNKFLTNTIPHELAHLISFTLYGQAGMGHKLHWKNVMRVLGVQASRCHCYQTTPARVVKRKFGYTCSCQRVRHLTAIKHNRILRGTNYICRICRTKIYRFRPLFDMPLTKI